MQIDNNKKNRPQQATGGNLESPQTSRLSNITTVTSGIPMARNNNDDNEPRNPLPMHSSRSPSPPPAFMTLISNHGTLDLKDGISRRVEFDVDVTRGGTGHIVEIKHATKPVQKQLESLEKLVINHVLPMPLKLGKYSLCLEIGSETKPYISAKMDGMPRLYIRARNATFDQITEPLDGKSVNYVITSCLFSAAHAVGVTNEGKQISILDPRKPLKESIMKIDVDPNFSFYETEAVERICQFTKKAGEGRDGPFTVWADLPRVQYYCYLFDAYEWGHVDKSVMLDWMSVVDRRSAQVFDRITEKLPDVDLTRIDGLAPIEAYVKRAVIAGKNPLLYDCIDILSDQDDLWRDILAVKPPKDWIDLNYLSYVYTELKSAKLCGDNGSASVALEHRFEERKIEQAAKLAKLLMKHNPDAYPNGLPFCGILIHEPIIMQAEDTSKSIYLYQIKSKMPSPDVLGPRIEKYYRSDSPHGF